MANIIKPKIVGLNNNVGINYFSWGGSPIKYDPNAIKEEYENVDYNIHTMPVDPVTKWSIEHKDDITRVAKRTLCSAANVVVSLIKGVAKFGEALVDTGAIIAGAASTPNYFFSDLGGNIVSLIKGDGWQGFKNTKALWEDSILPFVGKDHIGKYSKMFYGTKLGKTIDENAYSAFK